MKAESNMKFVHWEYNPDLVNSIESGKTEMKVGLTFNSKTNRATGIWFSWKYFLENGEQTILNCIGQDSYAIDNLGEISLLLLLLVRDNSFENFKRVFRERMDIIGFDYPEPLFPDAAVQIQGVLDQIRAAG